MDGFPDAGRFPLLAPIEKFGISAITSNIPDLNLLDILFCLFYTIFPKKSGQKVVILLQL